MVRCPHDDLTVIVMARWHGPAAEMHGMHSLLATNWFFALSTQPGLQGLVLDAPDADKALAAMACDRGRESAMAAVLWGSAAIERRLQARPCIACMSVTLMSCGPRTSRAVSARARARSFVCRRRGRDDIRDASLPACRSMFLTYTDPAMRLPICASG